MQSCASASGKIFNLSADPIVFRLVTDPHADRASLGRLRHGLTDDDSAPNRLL
jgi:hypothetical protein